MTRKEYVEWCKKRALELLDDDDMPGAFASMVSDMGKRDDTRIDAMLAALGMMEFNNGRTAMRRWIEGFN